MPKKKNKLNIQKYFRYFVIVSVVAVIAYALISLYSLGYRKGYLAGTENQVICQASQSNQALRALCK